MTAEAEHDAEGVEHEGDASGHGVAGPIRWGIGRRGWPGRGGCIGFHSGPDSSKVEKESRYIFLWIIAVGSIRGSERLDSSQEAKAWNNTISN
jgi:hypothetical protein